MDGDLTFNQGDIITVVKTDGEWWTGSKDGKTGIFPANYVKKMESTTKVGLRLLFWNSFNSVVGIKIP